VVASGLSTQAKALPVGVSASGLPLGMDIDNEDSLDAPPSVGSSEAAAVTTPSQRKVSFMKLSAFDCGSLVGKGPFEEERHAVHLVLGGDAQVHQRAAQELLVRRNQPLGRR